MKNIVVDGVTYVPVGSQQLELSKNSVIVRSESAGVFCGILTRSDLEHGGVVEMENARRLWYWAGAASLSQLAVDGTSKPSECKFPTAVPKISIAKVVEIIPCTEKAIQTINSVPIWKA